MANGYKKIAQGSYSGRLAATRISLWRGPDHLLQIERDYYTERYRRFYFADIEAFTISRNNRQRNIAILFTVIVAIFLIIAIFAPAGGVRIGFYFVVGFFCIPLIYNFVRGPTCVVRISTLVQSEELPSLRRVRKAERVLKDLIDAIQPVQGAMTPEEIRARFHAPSAPVAPPTVPSIELAPPPPPPSV